MDWVRNYAPARFRIISKLTELMLSFATRGQLVVDNFGESNPKKIKAQVARILQHGETRSTTCNRESQFDFVYNPVSQATRLRPLFFAA